MSDRREATGASGSPHLDGLDAVRVVGTLLVIVVHCDHWPLQQGGADLAFWSGVDLVARVCVPLFVILSGLLLTFRRQHRMPLRTFLRRRLGRSLLPWAIWMPVYTVIGLFITQEVARSPAGVAGWWLLGGGHLWYLLLIPQFYVVFQFWPTSRRGTMIAAAIAMAVQTGLCLYRLLAPSTAPLNGFFLAYGFEFFFFWIGYFALGATAGVWLADHQPRLPDWPFWLAAIGGAALLLGVNLSGATNASFVQGTGAFLHPLLPVLTGSLFIAVALTAERLFDATSRIKRLVSRVSRYSLGIYIVHEVLTYIPGRLLSAPLLQQNLPLAIPGFVLQVLLTLGLAYLATRLLVATPFAITVGLPREPLPPWPGRRAAL